LSFLVYAKDLVVRAESVVAIEAAKREVENNEFVSESMIFELDEKKLIKKKRNGRKAG
jgi:hypothetical protein